MLLILHLRSYYFRINARFKCTQKALFSPSFGTHHVGSDLWVMIRWSRARRRHLTIQEKPCSTTHRLGSSRKPPLDDLAVGLGSIVLVSEAVPRRRTV